MSEISETANDDELPYSPPEPRIVDDDPLEPWETYDPQDGGCPGCYYDGCPEDHPVGEVCVSGPEWDEDMPGRLRNPRHARLIAAAPDMLAALAELVTLKDDVKLADPAEYERRKEAAWVAARDAIAKAKGGPR